MFKLPSGLGRNYGVEIECFVRNVNTLRTNLDAAGLTTWVIKSDGSLHPTPTWKPANNYIPLELVSPILNGQEGLKSLQKAIRVLRDHKVKINKTCGLHVHVDGRGLTTPDFLSILNAYGESEPQIDKAIVGSRANNSFCASVTGRASQLPASVKQLDLFTRESWYDYSGNGLRTLYCRPKLTLYSLLRHGTVEFRHHGGTANFKKISRWIAFCLDFMERYKSNPDGSFCELPATPWEVLPATVQRHFLGRVRELTQNTELLE